MTLLLDEDPNLPSLSYQAKEHVPLYIPWTQKKPIAFGTGLDSSAASRDPAAIADVLRRSALPLLSSPLEYHFEAAEGSGSFRQNSTTSSSSSYEHLHFGGSISVGNRLLGASVRGQYAKDVYANRDSSKVSSQAAVRVGHVVPRRLPGLAPHAFRLLQSDRAAFHAAYGDYFLGGLALGAETATLLSTSSAMDLQKEMQQIQVDAKVLWWKKTVYKKTSTSRAAVNLVNGMDLDQRVLQALAKVGLGVEGGQTDVSEEQCAKLWASGLVVELLFLPYAGLRDYISAAAHPVSARSWDAFM
ncbi:hypothetical protein PHLGIDRAFT_305076 [Phlebiopsis gigantea 11061_1 CR5-6]|uniref:MACPF domain-containing protein n=1 Tax=Phlebiopsis gigantea (strain 11061_1 CR5-6) TaxID=745531 RepID=A0A0C3S049_PHLG1|nr:hypothetical protein PHLGIDRAFT_305076 [Phlebiopsis gigantea 11061_1 CR5-6]